MVGSGGLIVQNHQHSRVQELAAVHLSLQLLLLLLLLLQLLRPKPIANRQPTQVTVFAALLALDSRRVQARRVDCLPCLSLPKARSSASARAKAKARCEGMGGGRQCFEA